MRVSGKHWIRWVRRIHLRSMSKNTPSRGLHELSHTVSLFREPTPHPLQLDEQLCRCGSSVSGRPSTNVACLTINLIVYPYIFVTNLCITRAKNFSTINKQTHLHRTLFVTVCFFSVTHSVPLLILRLESDDDKISQFFLNLLKLPNNHRVFVERRWSH